MLAWIDAVEAEAETRFGDTRKALQLIRHAEEIFAEEAPRPAPPWLDWFSPVRLAGFKGNTLLADHQLGPAKETLQAVLEQLSEDAAKQRSVILGDPAAVAASESSPEDACRFAGLALDQLARTWYGKTIPPACWPSSHLTWRSCPRAGQASAISPPPSATDGGGKTHGRGRWERLC
jgi:hypothetical protein